jgi:hypothetical protein
VRATLQIVLAMGLAGSALTSTASAQIVCELCTEMQPGWDGFMVTSEGSSSDCEAVKESPAVSPGAAGAWRADARRVAAVAFGRLPAERGDDPRAEAIAEQMTVVLETDTDAIVLGRVGQTERRVCLRRSSPERSWRIVHLDVADLSRPVPAPKP